MRINVLSMFDGMGCGRLALEKSGIKVMNYFSCEIDKYASAVTKYHFPDTIELGDVNSLDTFYLPKIDLLLAGSPCQGFSFMGDQLAFDDPRSKLFFRFVEVLKELRHVNPDIKFLLENVKMKQKYLDVITEHTGVVPIMINSSLVSAQSRERWYWSNLTPKLPHKSSQHAIMDVMEPIYESDKTFTPHGRPKIDSLCYEVGFADGIKGHDFLKRVYSPWFKCPTLTAVCGGNQERKVAVTENTWRKLMPLECERLQNVPDDYTNIPFGKRLMSNSQRYKMLGNGWTINVISLFFTEGI